MLHEFLTSNHQELIRRCRQKVVVRFEPSYVPAAVNEGVPLLLQQIADTLRHEQSTATRDPATPAPAPTQSDVGRAAAQHGAMLLRSGYSIDQVVHEYGDVCQAVTEMAVEQNVAISAVEFHTLNRCLDNAIADAVTSFGRARQVKTNEQAQSVRDRLNVFADEHRRLVEIAIQSLTAIKSGSVGITGATGTLLAHALDELRSLAERKLPDIHLVSEATTFTTH